MGLLTQPQMGTRVHPVQVLKYAHGSFWQVWCSKLPVHLAFAFASGPLAPPGTHFFSFYAQRWLRANMVCSMHRFGVLERGLRRRNFLWLPMRSRPYRRFGVQYGILTGGGRGVGTER